MKQETGSNISVNDNVVSIQLPLGGHSFSAEQVTASLGTAAGGSIDKARTAKVVCTVLTPRTTLVPRECFDAASAEQYLRIAGLPRRSDETVVTSDRSAQIVAVMAVSSDCVSKLNGLFGDMVEFTSPLCGSQNYSEPTVWLHRAGDLIYIKVYRPVLRMAEAVEISSEADVMQLLHDLEPSLDVSHCTVVCSGDGSERLRKRLAKYYMNVKCE